MDRSGGQGNWTVKSEPSLDTQVTQVFNIGYV